MSKKEKKQRRVRCSVCEQLRDPLTMTADCIDYKGQEIAKPRLVCPTCRKKVKSVEAAKQLLPFDNSDTPVTKQTQDTQTMTQTGMTGDATTIAETSDIRQQIEDYKDGMQRYQSSSILSDRIKQENSKPIVRQKLQPTEEQQAILQAVQQSIKECKNNNVILVEAGAGTGKTATLRMLADVLPGVGQYTAFNAAPVNDNKIKFQGTRVACNTTHSLAFRAEGKRFAHRLNQGRVRADRLAKMLDIEELVLTIGEVVDEKTKQTKSMTKRLSPGWMASQVMGAIRRFCQSADRQVIADHFRYVDGIDLPKDGHRTYENNNQLREYLLPYAEDAWRDLSDPDGQLPFNHDHYVKIWQLNKPIISADYILLDESQDSSGSLLDILQQQIQTIAERKPLLVLVGDSAQQIYCQPRGTLVRIPVMNKDHCGRGIGGPSWGWKEVPIEILAAGDKVVTYGGSWRLGCIRMKGCMVANVTKQKFVGKLIAAQVGDKSSCYTPDHHCVVMLGDAGKGKWIVYMQRKGKHYRVGCCQGKHGSQFGPALRACHNKAEALWVLAVCNEKKKALSIERAIHSNFPDRGFSDSWWKGRRSNKAAAERILLTYGKRIDAPLLLRNVWIDKSRIPFVTQARNLMDGMLMLPADNAVLDNRCLSVLKHHWRPITLSYPFYEGDVFSISVDGDHTYIANGIVTHNSWRGAINAMAAFPNAPRLFLSQSFRFGEAIANLANKVLETLEEPTPLRLKGLPSIPSKIVPIAKPKAILCRTNALAVASLLEAIAEGRKPFLVGGGSDVIAFVEAAKNLQQLQPTGHPELACFSSWGEVQEYVKTDEDGADLKLLVKLIDGFGADTILSALRAMPAEKDADLVISTAHRSKGREWDSVRLASDFPTASKCCDADRKLLYVAVTRAKLQLDVGDCPFFTGNDSLSIDSILSGQNKPMPTEILPPTPSVPPALTTFTWSKSTTENAWLIRGPSGHTGETVDVERKDGSKSKKRLGSAVQESNGVATYRAI